MKTKEFLNLLTDHPDKEILFEYRSGQYVAKAYHITEVKNVHVDSVDCGGHLHSYDETVVQLWVNGGEQKDHYMIAGKAMKIFDIVNRKKPLRSDTKIFFEYGDEQTPTSVYEVDNVGIEDNQLIVKMSIPPTVCKPMQLLNVVQDAVQSVAGCCGPNSGCC